MGLVWKPDDDAFSTTIHLDGVPRFHLVVRLNGPWWEWSVSCAEDHALVARGRTVTRHGAMWDAERVASL